MPESTELLFNRVNALSRQVDKLDREYRVMAGEVEAITRRLGDHWAAIRALEADAPEPPVLRGKVE